MGMGAAARTASPRPRSERRPTTGRCGDSRTTTTPRSLVQDPPRDERRQAAAADPDAAARPTRPASCTSPPGTWRCSCATTSGSRTPAPTIRSSPGSSGSAGSGSSARQWDRTGPRPGAQGPARALPAARTRTRTHGANERVSACVRAKAVCQRVSALNTNTYSAARSGITHADTRTQTGARSHRIGRVTVDALARSSPLPGGPRLPGRGRQDPRLRPRHEQDPVRETPRNVPRRRARRRPRRGRLPPMPKLPRGRRPTRRAPGPVGTGAGRARARMGDPEGCSARRSTTRTSRPRRGITAAGWCSAAPAGSAKRASWRPRPRCTISPTSTCSTSRCSTSSLSATRAMSGSAASPARNAPGGRRRHERPTFPPLPLLRRARRPLLPLHVASDDRLGPPGGGCGSDVTLREWLGDEFAHDHCIRDVKAKRTPGQESLL